MSVNSRLKCQRKAFYRQKIPEPSCQGNRHRDRHSLVWHGDRKIIQSIRIMSRSPARTESGASPASSDEHLP